MRKARYLAPWHRNGLMEKSLKQCFTQWFNRKHGRQGTLWETRFKNELVEEGHAARNVAAYIDLNPIRAGMVKDPKDYRWCGYGEAVAGKKAAREGLRRVLFVEHATRMKERAGGELASWQEVQKKYRVVISPPSGPAQRLFQEPPAKSNFLAGLAGDRLPARRLGRFVRPHKNRLRIQARGKQTLAESRLTTVPGNHLK